MVGLIQKVLINMMMDLLGEDGVMKLKQEAGVPLDRDFQINIVYSDEEWQRLLAATVKILNITPEQAYTTYSGYFLKDVLIRFPTWFNMCENSFKFLSIQPTIHNCFATGVAEKELRDKINDKFNVEIHADDKKLITHYKSENRLCGLYIALAKTLIDHYKDEAIVDEIKCTKRGDDECEVHIQWTKLGDEVCHKSDART